MGKTYVIFIGRKPGIYETWEEAQKQVNKFSGASHRSFLCKEEAIKAFDSFMDKQAMSFFTPHAEEMSSATSSANATESTKSVQAEKLAKLEDAVSNLKELAEQIKKQIQSLMIIGDS